MRVNSTMLDLVIILCLVTALLLILIYAVGRIMAQISFTVNINIVPATVPLSAVSDPLNLSGQVGVPFSAALASNVQGGTPPYTLTATGTPPAGLSIDGSGNITGTPTAVGTSTLSVSVADAGA